MKMITRTPIRVTKTVVNRQNAQEQSADGRRDPVKVFCRLRPLLSDGDLACACAKNATTLILTPPEQAINHKQCAPKETQYIFKHIFEASVTQRGIFEMVAQPLVENLIKGKNSLLFTYGVTGSGKTYTMTGSNNDRGIMPRCLDALFHSISDYQAKKYIFKPDRLNGFEILSEADAILERQAEMNRRFAGVRGGGIIRKHSDLEIASQASQECPVLQGMDEDNMYAVFVTYVEIYNNSVYDLLEDVGIQKSLQSKIVREDENHNMFVHGVTELEVKCVEEALDAFHIGQKRKRIGHTILNAESSRSHSVFNIRLVQAPTDSRGENIVQDKDSITVSQLSLVDLAGSERSSRTNNMGARLREAGNINNSLMTLRTCLEYLRQNQQATSATAIKKIPYRDSKLTHLFKNFFDGEGQISMIVCINPRLEDYDENTQVMKFAEMTQEIKIARATPIKQDLGLTPGRRKANKLFKTAVSNLNDLGMSDAKRLDVDIGLVYSLGPGFPDYNLNSLEAETTIQELMRYLMQRIEKRKMLSMDLEEKYGNFRMQLLQTEKENLSLRTELASLKAVYGQEHKRCVSLENKLRSHEGTIDTLNAKVSSRERQIDELTRKLNEHQNLLTQKEREKDRQKKRFNSKLAIETDKKNRELEVRLREQRAKLDERMRIKDEKLRLVSSILQSDDVPTAMRRSRSVEHLHDGKIVNNSNNNKQQHQQHQHQQMTHGSGAAMAESIPTSARTDAYYCMRSTRGLAAANNRHRRSHSVGERWIEHRASNPVPLGTILQPYLKNRKSITKLTDMKDLIGHKATNYCLVSQEADTDGDVETKLYKGNVIPTCGGGAQVVFNDVECLKQKSPVASPNRKRPSETIASGVVTLDSATSALMSINSAHDVAAKCTIGIEGHHIRNKVKKPKLNGN